MTKTLYSTSISAAKGLMKRAGSVLFVYILGRSQFVIAISRMRRRNFQFTGDPDRRAQSLPSVSAVCRKPDQICISLAYIP